MTPINADGKEENQSPVIHHMMPDILARDHIDYVLGDIGCVIADPLQVS
jgi:hypothetical protein